MDRIEEIITASKAIADAHSPLTVNLSVFNNTITSIDNLRSIKLELINTLTRVEDALNKMENVHRQSMDIINKVSMIGKNHTSKPAWAEIAAASPQEDSITPFTEVRKGKSKLPISSVSSPVNIKITPAHGLNVQVVNTWDQVKCDGSLYFVGPNQHFAFRIAGLLFHGNIGEIYMYDDQLRQVNDCKYRGTCKNPATCQYYHDPMYFPNSTDHRNYVNTSWMYAGSANANGRSGNKRTIGSRTNIDTDITQLNDYEISRFNDQVTHDVLVALLISQTRHS
jgi:hypothetical protein